jgi:ribose 5-phosphate isomerase B
MDLEALQRQLRQTRRRGGAAARGGDPEPGPAPRIAIGADHGGWQLKRVLIDLVRELGWEVEDVGTHGPDPVDYPDYAVAVARRIAGGTCSRGIVIDGAGLGSCMVANKIRGVRAATCHDEASIVNSRAHNDANVLALGAARVHAGLARRLVRIWLATPFEGGRHARRVDKIVALDNERPV